MNKTTSAGLLAFAAAILFGSAPLAGCSTRTRVPEPRPAAAAKLPSWPSLPAPTRIRYARSIAGAQDWGIEKSLFRRIVDAIAGGGDERFVRPTAVVESQRVLYVADPGAQALWILDAERNEVYCVKNIGDEALQSPVAVALRPDGAVYLADSRLRAVFLLGRDGKPIGTAQRGFERPTGLAYDAARQRLYVADSAAQKIIAYGPDGSVVRSWGVAGGGDGEFNYPTHLALDAAGALLVTDALNFRVQAFDPDGRFLWKFGHLGDGSGDVVTPKGVAVDADGHVFLVNALFDAVQIFDREGRFLLGFGERGTGPGQFWLPNGIWITGRNELYVADAYNRRVQVFTIVADREVKEERQ